MIQTNRMDDEWRRRLGLLPTAVEQFLEQDRRLREALEGPIERSLRDLYDSPMERALRDFAESPSERAAREASLSAIGHLTPELEDSVQRMLREMSVDAAIVEQARLATGGFLELEAATESIQRLLGDDTLTSLAHAVAATPRWQSAIEGAQASMGNVGPEQAAFAVAQSHLEFASGISTVAEARLAGLDLSTMDSVIGHQLADTLRDVTTDLAASYRAVFEGLDANPRGLADFPPRAVTWSAEEVYRHTEILQSVASPRGSSQPVEPVAPQPQPTTRPLDPLLERLALVDPALVSAIQGARQVAVTDNPERLRYVAVSQREAITKVLHFLAPDDNVKQWTREKKHYHDGHPTRRARVEYIFRRHQYGAFTELVAVDVEGLLKSIEVLQAGTHKVGVQPPQIFITKLLSKMEWVLGFILEVGLDPEDDE